MKLLLNMKCSCKSKLILFRELNSFLFGIHSKHIVYKCENTKCDKYRIRTTTKTTKRHYNLFWEMEENNGNRIYK